MARHRPGSIRFTMELDPKHERMVDEICDGIPRSQGIRKAIQVFHRLRQMENGSKLVLVNRDGTAERILLL